MLLHGSGKQLPEAERLDDVVVGAHLQADNLVHLLTFAVIMMIGTLDR